MHVDHLDNDASPFDRGTGDRVAPSVGGVSSCSGERASAGWKENSLSWLQDRVLTISKHRDYVEISILRVVFEEDSTIGNTLSGAPNPYGARGTYHHHVQNPRQHLSTGLPT